MRLKLRDVLRSRDLSRATSTTSGDGHAVRDGTRPDHIIRIERCAGTPSPPARWPRRRRRNSRRRRKAPQTVYGENGDAEEEGTEQTYLSLKDFVVLPVVTHRPGDPGPPVVPMRWVHRRGAAIGARRPVARAATAAADTSSTSPLYVLLLPHPSLTRLGARRRVRSYYWRAVPRRSQRDAGS